MNAIAVLPRVEKVVTRELARVATHAQPRSGPSLTNASTRQISPATPSANSSATDSSGSAANVAICSKPSFRRPVSPITPSYLRGSVSASARSVQPVPDASRNSGHFSGVLGLATRPQRHHRAIRKRGNWTTVEFQKVNSRISRPTCISGLSPRSPEPRVGAIRDSPRPSAHDVPKPEPISFQQPCARRTCCTPARRRAV